MAIDDGLERGPVSVPGTETAGNILVTIEEGPSSAEPRCGILAAITEHRGIRQVFVQLVERFALLPRKVLKNEASSDPHRVSNSSPDGVRQ